MKYLVKVTHRSGIGEFFEFLEKIFERYSLDSKVVVSKTLRVKQLFTKVFESDSVLFEDHPQYLLQNNFLDVEKEIYCDEDQFKDRPRYEDSYKKLIYTKKYKFLPKVLRFKKSFKDKARKIIEELGINSKIGIHLRHDPRHPGDFGPYHYYKVRESLVGNDYLNIFLSCDNYFYKNLLARDFPKALVTEYPKKYNYSKNDVVEIYDKFHDDNIAGLFYEAILEATLVSQCETLYLNKSSSFSSMIELLKEIYARD